MTFPISPCECWYSPLKIRVSYSSWESFRVLLLLWRHMVPLSNGNCRFTIPMAKGRCARDALARIFNIGEFESVEKLSTTAEHIYNESANIIEGYDFAVYPSNFWNFPLTVSVIGTEGMVTRARLRYTRDYLTPGRCSLIKPDGKLIPFPAKIHRVMLWLCLSNHTLGHISGNSSFSGTNVDKLTDQGCTTVACTWPTPILTCILSMLYRCIGLPCNWWIYKPNNLIATACKKATAIGRVNTRGNDWGNDCGNQTYCPLK